MTAPWRPGAAQVIGLGPFERPVLRINGVDEYGVEWVGRLEGWTQVGADLPITDSAGDGGWFGVGRRPARVLTLTGAYRACDASAVAGAEDRFRDAVEVIDADQTLWVTEDPPKQVSVRQSGPCLVDPVLRNPRGRRFSVVLTAADPNKYAAGVTGLSRVDLALAAPGFAGAVFPAVFPWGFGSVTAALNRAVVVNPGRVTVPAVLTMTGPTPTRPRLVNATSGAEFILNAPLGAGSTAVIDCGLETITIDGVPRPNARAPGSQFWGLVRGANDLRFLADDYAAGAVASVSFRPAWR